MPDEEKEDEGKSYKWPIIIGIILIGAVIVCGGLATGAIEGIDWLTDAGEESAPPVAHAVTPTSAFMYNNMPTVARTFKGVNSLRGEEEFFIGNVWGSNDPSIVRNAGEIYVPQCLPQIGISTEPKRMYDLGTKGQAGYVYCGNGYVFGWCNQALPDDCMPPPTKANATTGS